MLNICQRLLLNSRIRSNRLQMFFKIGVLKSFAIFRGKQLCWSLFLIKLQALVLQHYLKEKRDPNTCISCEYCKIFKNSFFYRTLLVAASAESKICLWYYSHNVFNPNKVGLFERSFSWGNINPPPSQFQKN